MAPIRQTRIHFVLACAAGERHTAHAFETVYKIDARTAIATWIIYAVIDVRFAIDASVAGHAVARVRSEPVDTNTAMLTRIRIAFVDILLAPFATVAGRAMANKLIDAIFAAAAIDARTRRTFVDIA